MRDLRAILTWLLHEARAAAGFAREREIWIALAAGLLLWMLAYQASYTYRLDLGGNLQTDRRDDDTPFLDNFNAPEPNPIPDHATLLYRWSRADSTVVFPGLGGGRWLARVRASSGSRPEPLLSQWDDGAHSYTIAATKVQRDYAIIVEADSAGDLTLHFATPPLTPEGDRRTLGLVMSRLVIEPVGGIRVPAARQLALLGFVLALAYALLRRFALAGRPALAVALALAALAALLLARERMALTLLTPLLPAILGGCYALGLGLDALLRIVDCRLQIADYRYGANNRPSSIVHRPSSIVALILLAVALRLGGMLHPHAIFSDDGLNAHNLSGLTSGKVYFTEGLPSEAGGGQAPYPPGQYIMFAPAQLLIQTRSDDITALRLLLKIANAVWDSLVVGLVWYVLRRCGCGSRAALLGAALYVLPPPLLRSLSVGEFANVFGQGLALPLLALLAVRVRELQQKPFLIVLPILFALALLGHLGVTISLICLLVCLGLFWLIRPDTRRAFRILLFAGVLAGALVALLYYTALGDVLVSRISSPSASVSGDTSPSITQKLAQQAGTARVYGIHALALALGLIGAALVALVPSRGRVALPGLGMLLLAWWGGTLLSLGLLLFANQGVRWQSFLYPALCLGAGPALATLWARGHAGRAVIAGLVAFLAWYGLAFWVVQISDYLH
jgi:hypothetical protein